MEKIVNGVAVEMTPEQEAAFEADRLAMQPTLPQRIATAVTTIDADVDALYAALIGNRQAEYERAEREAQAFADAGYPVDVPSTVQSWATAKGWTAQQAADDILTAAGAWRVAQAQIRAARLLRKEQARTAASPEALAEVMQAWGAYITAVRNALGA